LKTCVRTICRIILFLELGTLPTGSGDPPQPKESKKTKAEINVLAGANVKLETGTADYLFCELETGSIHFENNTFNIRNEGVSLNFTTVNLVMDGKKFFAVTSLTFGKGGEIEELKGKGFIFTDIVLYEKTKSLNEFLNISGKNNNIFSPETLKRLRNLIPSIPKAESPASKEFKEYQKEIERGMGSINRDIYSRIISVINEVIPMRYNFAEAELRNMDIDSSIASVDRKLGSLERMSDKDKESMRFKSFSKWVKNDPKSIRISKEQELHLDGYAAEKKLLHLKKQSWCFSVNF